MVTIGTMFAIMTYLAYIEPLTFFDSWYPYLYMGLIGIIVSQLANIIFSDLEHPFFDFSVEIGLLVLLLYYYLMDFYYMIHKK